MKITVIGCGYLGATHAACLAELGFETLGVETDPRRLAALRAGQAPVHEPGLDEMLARHVASGRLRFTDSVAEAGAWGEVHLLCVGTPQADGSLAADVGPITAAVTALAPALRPGATVVGRSTVPVGTAARLRDLIAELAPGRETHLAWSPEFLREGFGIIDTLTPDRLVLGVESETAEAVLRRVFTGHLHDETPVIVTDLATAELVKVSANAFLATKISFINAISEVCDVAGADVGVLADALGADNRIGRRFLNAGIGFGGGCLPKDIRAFAHRADELGVGSALTFLREVDRINLRTRTRLIELCADLVGDLDGARIAVLGFAFKPDTDDVRDSPALWIADRLHRSGALVRAYDPAATANARREQPDLTYVDSVEAACADADLVLHLTEWPEFAKLDPAQLREVVAHPRIVDGRLGLDKAQWQAAGWDVRRLGRR